VPPQPAERVPKKLHRIGAVCDRTGLGRATVYEHIGLGTMTPPIRIGPKWSAWPSDEIDAILAARISSWSDDQLRRLVKGLIAARKRVAPDIGIEGGGYESTRETPEGSGAPRALD
jgi:prophage regulatory protein